jgi:hypothetical protein
MSTATNDPSSQGAGPDRCVWRTRIVLVMILVQNFVTVSPRPMFAAFHQDRRDC